MGRIKCICHIFSQVRPVTTISPIPSTVSIPNCDLQITTNIETAIPDVETGVPMGMESTLSAIDSKKHLSIYTNDKIPTQLDIVGPLCNTVKVEIKHNHFETACT